jgi:hypothetical protein
MSETSKRLQKLYEEYFSNPQAERFQKETCSFWFLDRKFDHWCKYGLFGLKVPQYGD